MAGSGRKWLTGCGIGCGLLILVAGGIGTCGYFSIKRISERADRVEEAVDDLNARYGRPATYAPAPDGSIAADRMETFLAVRDSMAPVRDGLAAILAGLDEDVHGPGGVVAKIRMGVDFLPRLFDFVAVRTDALAEQGMGLGEYLHIYSVAYYAWLGEDPADGPDFAIANEDEHEGFTFSTDDDPGDVRDRRREEVRRTLHDLQRKMLDNQLAGAEAAGLDPAWLDTLRAEVAAMDGAPRRLLWEDGVPAPLERSLAPYRARLEASYTPVMNIVEVGLVQHD